MKCLCIIYLAERGGFEPPWELVAPKSISSRSRYDHFGTSPDFFAITRQRRCTQRLCIIFWRRERDSNPRYTFVGVHTISSRAPSATQTSLRGLFDCRIGFYPLFLKKSTQNFPAFLP